MEPQGSSKRSANQLQGAALQDQAVQPCSAAETVQSDLEIEHPISTPEGPDTAAFDSSRSEKVVVQFGARTLRGYLENPAWDTVEDLLSHAPHGAPETFRVRHLDSDQVEEISASKIKAVFYVNSFEGDSDHQELNFHSRAPIVHGIWVRLQFLDGEVMEGIVFNSLRYLVDPGFFLLPTDPDSNNKLVYVRKSCLADHRVLGMRKLPR